MCRMRASDRGCSEPVATKPMRVRETPSSDSLYCTHLVCFRDLLEPRGGLCIVRALVGVHAAGFSVHTFPNYSPRRQLQLGHIQAFTQPC